jgi:predicted DNA binding CopG/RHH family protein
MTNTVKKKNEGLDPTADDAVWDNFQLGTDEKFVRVSAQGTEARLDESLRLQMISMRLPKDAVEKLKSIAREQGLGYQPLIRQILMNYLRDHKSKP